MPKLVRINIPAEMRESGEHITATADGYVARLYVGNYQHKFLLQVSPHTGRVTSLTHYASGYRVGDLRDARIRAMYGRKDGGTIDDRTAAKLLINNVVSRIGADKANMTLNGAPVINR